MSQKKHEWRKAEKQLYLPEGEPVKICIPPFKFFAVSGKGDPNSESFGKDIEILYALSYAIRMSYKKGNEPDGFYEYTVYPLEGVWDISEEAKERGGESFMKDELVHTIMIRQPDFVTNDYAAATIDSVKEKKPDLAFEKARFISIEEGECVQMMHKGSYDYEPQSFEKIEDFCSENGLKRKSKKHREIYISDPRKVEPEKLRTVLRVQVEVV